MIERTKAAPRLHYGIHGGRYDGAEPWFFDASAFPWTRALTDNWQVIRDELEQLIASHEQRLTPYISPVLVFPPQSWKNVGFYFWRLKMHKNCALCPRTMAILDAIPNVVGASLSVLEPGSNINPHQGDTNANYRVHLGLTVPCGLPDCGFAVGDEIRAWREGGLLIFCDAHRHTAWNHSERRRLVFIVDVIRPEFASRSAGICAHVLASTALQVVYARVGWLRRRSERLHHGLQLVLRLVARAVVPVQRRLGGVLHR